MGCRHQLDILQPYFTRNRTKHSKYWLSPSTYPYCLAYYSRSAYIWKIIVHPHWHSYTLKKATSIPPTPPTPSRWKPNGSKWGDMFIIIFYSSDLPRDRKFLGNSSISLLEMVRFARKFYKNLTAEVLRIVFSSYNFILLTEYLLMWSLWSFFISNRVFEKNRRPFFTETTGIAGLRNQSIIFQ